MAMAASASIAVAPASSSSSSSPSSPSSSILPRRFLHPQSFPLLRSSSPPLPPLSFSSRRHPNPNPNLLLCRSQEEDIDASSAAGASSDSIVSQVALLEEEPETPGVAPNTNGSAVSTPSPKKLSPLQKGGTLTGERAAGLDPSPATLGKSGRTSSISGAFSDPRWKNGTWDLKQFASEGKVNWDAVIDAEVVRRKWLEENPESSKNEDPVVFDTSTIPWWAWVKRFHLPEAELLNGRAAMIGYVMGYFVDALTGAGLVDQTNNFFGKLLLLISVIGVLSVRKNEDFETLKQLAKEFTFYDKQWQATWQEEKAPGSQIDQ